MEDRFRSRAGWLVAVGLLSLGLGHSQPVTVHSRGHTIMVDRPDAVIDAICEVVEAVRTHSRLNP